jgi:hypothetical protein
MVSRRKKISAERGQTEDYEGKGIDETTGQEERANAEEEDYGCSWRYVEEVGSGRGSEA